MLDAELLHRSRATAFQLARDVGPVAPLVVALLVWMAWDGGGYSPDQWGLPGLALLGLLVVAVVADPPHLPLGERRSRIVMLAALAAFVAWNYLSILWAHFPGDAWIGSDKTLLYACVFALFALWRWEADAVLVVLGIYALAVTACGALLLVQATTSQDPDSFFQSGRLLPPIGYVNANVALWMLAFFPAVFLGSLRTLPAVLRGLMLGCAAVLLDLILIGESRGWLFLLPAFAVAALALSRQRLRLLVATAFPTVGMLAIVQPLLDVFKAPDAGKPIGPPLDHAARLILVSSLVVGAAGLVWSLLDRTVVVPRRVHVAAGAVVVALTLVGVAGAAVRVKDAVGSDPGGWVHRHWKDFTRGWSIDSHGKSSRFTGSIGTDRYLTWKVAVIEFRDHPVAGIGSDNYLEGYLLRRKTDYIDPLFPHSTPLRLLSELGVIGTALFTAFFGIAVALALRRRRRLEPVAAGAVGTCLTMVAYWLIHGSIDFFWEIPALGASAFAFLGLAASTALTAAPESTTPAAELQTSAWRLRQPARAALLGISGVAAAAAVVALSLPWLANRYEQSGLSVASQDPTAAYARLGRAASLNPLSAEPYVIEGSIALQRRELARARMAFDRAIDREPKNWYAYFQLALVSAVQKRYGPASVDLERARSLNPADTTMQLAARIIKRHGRVDPEVLNALYLKELNRRLMGNPRL